MYLHTIIHKLIPFDDLFATIQRFPLSVITSTLMFFYSLLIVHGSIDDTNEEMIGKILSLMGCSYFLFGVLTLLSESKSWKFSQTIILSLLSVVFLGLIIFTATLWWIQLFFLIPALLLLVMVAPYVSQGDDLSFWVYNRNVWLGVFVSYAALILFACGISAALLAIHTLFDIEINEKAYLDIWMFAGLVLGPVYALSWIPKRFTFVPEECGAPLGLGFIANWISAPMVLVYLLILYAYFAKIALQGSLPNGNLAYLISGFAGAGVVTYLVSWPLAQTGGPFLKLFYRIFFIALILPVCVHIYAVWERVHNYGITEQRYALILSCIWLVLAVLLFAFRKSSLKFLPGILALLLFLAAFGPWGAVQVSGESQYNRLRDLLMKNSLLRNERAVASNANITFDDRKRISSIINYLCSTERDVMIAPWFAEKGKEAQWSCYGAYELTKQFGFDPVDSYQTQEEKPYFNIYGPREIIKSVEGYDFLLPDISLYSCAQSPNGCSASYDIKNKDDNTHVLKLSIVKDGMLDFVLDEKNILSFSLTTFANENINRQNANDHLFLTTENEHITVRIDFHSLAGTKEDGNLVVNNVSFDLLFKLKK